jgi:hypothetical protein
MTTSPATPRGIRNCNPLNLRPIYNPDGVQVRRVGETLPDADGYSVFLTMQEGLRGAFLNLWCYFYEDKTNTVESIIKRWAPAADKNDVEDYVQNVLRQLPGVTAGVPLNYWNIAGALLRAMAVVELGQEWAASIFENEWAGAWAQMLQAKPQ